MPPSDARTMRVALVRHPVPRVAPGTCYGRLDIDLHPDGLADLPRIAAALAAFEGLPVWTSPARRCRSLAAVLSARAVADARLRELDFGDWEGARWDDVDRAALDRWAADPLGFAPPGGESGAALVGRTRRFHALLRRRAQDCVVVSHGGPLKVLRALLAGEPVGLLGAAMPFGGIEVIDAVRSSRAAGEPSAPAGVVAQDK